MEMVLAIFSLVALAWWGVYVRHGSLWVGGGGVIALGYILGPPLWNPQIGPIPLTIDRLLLLGLGAAYVWRWRFGRLASTPMTAADWLLLAAIGYFTVRCAMTPAAPLNGSEVKPVWRLIAAFWIPSALYLAARTAPDGERAWRAVLWVFAGLGAYLSLTAFAEIARLWWAVFPRYISDPTQGTHFGRARGPALNSASLGVMLTVCFWAAWTLWPRLTRLRQLAMIGLLGAIAAAVYFTYTRSTWIGLAAGLATIPLIQLPRWRVTLALGVVLAGAIGIVTLSDDIADLGRKDTDGSAEHSVYQRASFAFVSMRMFRDAPLTGCGFGRFYDMKIPYLADRSQQLELESLRNLDHHNTFLSVLVETGLIGFALFVALLATWTWAACSLIGDADRPPWQRAHGLFALATLLAYVASALFHDLTLSPTEHWPLFFTAGLTMSLVTRRPAAAVACLEPVRPFGATALAALARTIA